MSTTALKSNPVLFADDVEQTLDLGKGFMVIKLRQHTSTYNAQNKPSKNPWSILNTDFPDIALNKIQALLERHIPSTPSKQDKASTAALQANQEFTARLDKQSLDYRQWQLDEGLLLTSANVLAPLGISRQALSKAVKEHRMFFVDGPSGTQLYPAFFVTDKQKRRILEKISRALGDLPGPSKWQFFVTPKLSLDGRSPVAALNDGDVDINHLMAAALAFRGQ